MKTSNVSKISASIPNTKKSKFNLSHDVNTSYDWGSVQPLFGKFMLPDSSININAEQLTRLAPMVVPTFGRVKMKNVAHFVPMQEIFPNWQAMLSQTMVTRSSVDGSSRPNSHTFVPKTVPYINTNVLAMMTLMGAKCNVYFSGTVGTDTEDCWYCARNTGTYGSPAGWTQATTATRIILWDMFGIATTNNPSTTTITPYNYTGFAANWRRLPLKKDGTILLNASNSVIGLMPTMSTLLTAPIPGSSTLGGWTHTAGNEADGVGGISNVKDVHISFEGADMIWEYDGSDPTQGIRAADRAANSGQPVQGLTATGIDFIDGRKIRVVFKLSSFGKRLRKILIGLGYNVNLSDDTEVSILPLVAFYKAWWDTYAPERYRNFYETNCWKLINASLQDSAAGNIRAYVNVSATNDYCQYFQGFIADLGNCFATEKMDVISAATDKYYGSTNTTTSNVGHDDIERAIQDVIENLIETGGIDTTNYDNQLDGTSNAKMFFANNNTVQSMANMLSLQILNPGINSSPYNFASNLTQPHIDALKKAYVMINKTSVAGQKVEEILRALGFGDYVEECRGKFLASSDDTIKISDVVATAATDDAKLGQYGGRGLGVDNFQVSFSTKQHGFLIILSAIVPEAGYINGPARENEAISFDKLYNPEFDGLAYEAIEKKNLIGSPLINDGTCLDTFGYLPTYSQWKFMSNKANGDFSLNSQKNSLRPYTLDKYIPVSDVGTFYTMEDPNHAGTTVEECNKPFKYSDLPNAGEDYRYVNKFPWNGDFNRIFAAEDDGLNWAVFSPNNNAFLYNSFEYDNFLVHNVFTVQYWAHMKSIEDSYGTYDQEHGVPNASISKS